MKHSTPIAQSLFLSVLLAGTGACQESGHAPPSGETKVTVTPVATGLQHPWGLAFLPDGRMLVTERPGRLRYVSPDGTLSEPVAGVPAVHAVNQGGLLDVALDPAFATNSVIYLSFAERGEGEENGTAVARARLAGMQLEDVTVIYRQRPKFASGHHFGSRLVFAKDGTLFVTQGDRNKLREAVQDLSTDIGKVVRIRTDGSAAADNPFTGREGARPEIWSYGHRNIQGAALHPATGELWTHEHGPRGGDELNVTLAGRNYGWPVITYGREYHGPAIGEGTSKSGMEQPLHYWVPSIGPSGMAFHDGNGYPQWKGQLFVGALAAKQLVRLELDSGGRVRAEERIAIGERVRDVRVGPDGALYLLTDEDPGRLLRVVPAE
ncbi:MAG TPA: PQQ-dependent sugar dehydrogenase [Steroidobacteraceae bacterium]|nr:PQQ-dependent sugar dehydrogenase [Steroidobacteraceae bacterium]